MGNKISLHDEITPKINLEMNMDYFSRCSSQNQQRTQTMKSLTAAGGRNYTKHVEKIKFKL